MSSSPEAAGDGRARSGAALRPHVLGLVAVFAALHLPLCLHDALHPEAWLQADRAASRLKKIEHLLAADPASGGLADRLIANGPLGDYLAQTAPYAALGRGGVIAAQLLLGLIATLVVFALGRRWLGSSRAAFLAAVVFMLLPASLLHPHVLASEAVYNPLIVIGFALTTAHLAGRAGFAPYAVGLAAFGLAAFTRTQFALFPLILTALLVVAARRPWTDRTVLLVPVLGLAPLLLWTAFVYLSLGTLDTGPTNYSLGHNAYLRVARMAGIAGVGFDASAYPDREMPLGDLIGHAAAAPAVFLRTLVSDLVNLVANPGTNALFGQYLGALDVEADRNYWAELRDREGLGAMLLSVAVRSPAFALAVFGGALLWGAVLLLTALGGWAFFRERRAARVETIVLAALVLYSLLVPFAAYSVRWAFRSPLDFVLAPLCVLGAVRLLARLRRARREGAVPARA